MIFRIKVFYVFLRGMLMLERYFGNQHISQNTLLTLFKVNYDDCY